jgi:hypothetical protein
MAKAQLSTSGAAELLRRYRYRSTGCSTISSMFADLRRNRLCVPQSPEGPAHGGLIYYLKTRNRNSVLLPLTLGPVPDTGVGVGDMGEC